MAKLSSADLLEAFREMTLLELADFVREFEEAFGVLAAVAPAPPGPDGPAAEEDEEDEQTEFEVVLESPGDKKIQVIKEVRSYAKLGLKEAKDLVDAAPGVVLLTDRETAQRLAEAIKGAGGTVTVR